MIPARPRSWPRPDADNQGRKQPPRTFHSTYIAHTSVLMHVQTARQPDSSGSRGVDERASKASTIKDACALRTTHGVCAGGPSDVVDEHTLHTCFVHTVYSVSKSADECKMQSRLYAVHHPRSGSTQLLTLICEFRSKSLGLTQTLCSQGACTSLEPPYKNLRPLNT
jgi:hypothetical protein